MGSELGGCSGRLIKGAGGWTEALGVVSSTVGLQGEAESGNNKQQLPTKALCGKAPFNCEKEACSSCPPAAATAAATAAVVVPAHVAYPALSERGALSQARVFATAHMASQKKWKEG